jgi:hypothetical protein
MKSKDARISDISFQNWPRKDYEPILINSIDIFNDNQGDFEGHSTRKMSATDWKYQGNLVKGKFRPNVKLHRCLIGIIPLL